MKKIRLALLTGPALALFASVALAEDCPAPADHSEELSALFDKADQAPNDRAGREISDRMWRIWLRAPNEQAQEVLDRGMRRRDSYDFIGANADFTVLAEYCPLYAEGFNQRAYIAYLREDYESALVDLDRALSLSPTHVAAQSGRALTLMQLGRTDEARSQLLEALENNPWLSERFLLAKGGPLAPDGEDI